MWPLAIATLGAGALSYFGATQANDANAGIAADNRSWQQHMSDTAHQREVSDLKAAGLNPILSAGGGGASTPPGSTAVMQNPMAGPADAIKGAVSNVMDAKRLSADLDAIKASAAKDSSQTSLNETQQDVAKQDLRRTSAMADTAEAQAFSAKNKMDYESKNPGLFGAADAVLSRLGLASGTAKDLLLGGGAMKYLFTPKAGPSGGEGARSLPNYTQGE